VGTAVIVSVAIVVLVSVILVITAFGGFEYLKAGATFIKVFSFSIEVKNPRSRHKGRQVARRQDSEIDSDGF
jgi:hypothetical protein